jgi:hypothetical protein
MSKSKTATAIQARFAEEVGTLKLCPFREI